MSCRFGGTCRAGKCFRLARKGDRYNALSEIRWLPFVEDIRNSLRENAKEISLRLASYRLLAEEAARDAIGDRRG